MIALRMSDADSALTLIEAGADLFIKTSSGEDVMSAVKDLMDDAVYDAVFLRYESRRISQVFYSLSLQSFSSIHFTEMIPTFLDPKDHQGDC